MMRLACQSAKCKHISVAIELYFSEGTVKNIKGQTDVLFIKPPHEVKATVAS